jgi:hypothetical protein
MNRVGNWRFAVPPLLAIVFTILAFLRVPYVNGPRYWKWHWVRHESALAVAAAFGFAALPALISLVVRERTPQRRDLIVGLLSLSAVALPLTAAGLHRGRSSTDWIGLVMTDASVTGFLTSAQEIVDFEHRRPDVNWVRVYDKIMPFFPLHARTKPAGLVVAHYLVFRLAGTIVTMVIAVVVALVCAAALVTVAIAAFRAMGFESSIATDAATLLVLAPSMTLFSPLPDIAYPLLTLTAIACWWKAVMRSDLIAAAVAALVIFAASLISYPLMGIGIPLFLMTVVRPPRSVIGPVAVAAAVFFGAYAVLALTTHYPALAAFESALDAQKWLLSRLRRPYPQSIPFDIIDYCLGLGWVTPALAVMGIAASRRMQMPLVGRTLLIGGLLTPVAIATMGLMQAENARVWIFLMPLTALPAAIELSSWPLRPRLVACACLVMVTIALHSTMEFIFV